MASGQAASDDRGRTVLVIVAIVVLFAMVTAFAGTIAYRAEQSATAALDPGRPQNADGRSNLPGSRARLTFEPLRGQNERFVYREAGAPFSGSEWRLTQERTYDFIRLRYEAYPAGLPERGDGDGLVAQVQSEATSDAGDLVPLSEKLRIDGLDAYRFEYTSTDGRRIVRVVVLGAQEAFFYDCNLERFGSETYDQCEDALSSLRFER